jgi:hypothetical protein
MNFQKSRALLLVGAVMVASAAYTVSPASAQQATNCVAGLGNNCEDTFGASSVAKSPAAAANSSTAKYDAYVAKKEKQQAVLSVALTRAAEQGIKGIMKACQAVSPNKPIDACP